MSARASEYPSAAALVFLKSCYEGKKNWQHDLSEDELLGFFIEINFAGTASIE